MEPRALSPKDCLCPQRGQKQSFGGNFAKDIGTILVQLHDRTSAGALGDLCVARAALRGCSHRALTAELASAWHGGCGRAARTAFMPPALL